MLIHFGEAIVAFSSKNAPNQAHFYTNFKHKTIHRLACMMGLVVDIHVHELISEFQ